VFFCEVGTYLLNNNNNNNNNFSKRLQCRKAAHVIRFKETFQRRYYTCIKVHNFERPVGEWSGTECSSEVTADAELYDGNENFTSTNFTKKRRIPTCPVVMAGPAAVVQDRTVSVDRTGNIAVSF
jgi:hypothetical protein